MFGIDPVSYHSQQNNFVLESRLKNFYAEILLRAIDDLHYYKNQISKCNNAIWEAHNNAKNAQLWLDDKIKSSAVTAETVRKILDIEKFVIDRYLDYCNIRFDFNKKKTCLTKRQQVELQTQKRSSAKMMRPIYKPCQTTHQLEEEGDPQNITLISFLK